MSGVINDVEDASETRPEEETQLRLNLEKYLDTNDETEEQKSFNQLSMDDKLDRLNHLVQQSQVYSQIILDNMLEKSLQKKRLREQIERGEIPEPTPFQMSSLESLEKSDSEEETAQSETEESDESDEELTEETEEPVEKSTEPSDVTDQELDEPQVISDSDSEDNEEEEEDKEDEGEEQVIQPKKRVLSRISNQGRVAARKINSKAPEVIEVDLESSDDDLAPSSRTRLGKRSLPRSLPMKLRPFKKAKSSKKTATQKKSESLKKATKQKKPKSKVSNETKKTKEAIEAAQTGHKQAQPSLVTGCIMKDYQLDGLEWLVTLYENGLNGILGDEMGLGKTLQCIALTAYLIEHGVKGPFLVVAPLSTVSNWCREFQRFAPKIKVLNYTGEKSQRKKQQFGKTLKAQVVVTSYEVVIKDHMKFLRPHWKYLTVDEGHRLKNFDCILTKFLKRLNVGNRLLLTGTPLQNNLQELWSLLNFILPDIFQDLELFQLWFDFDDFGVSGVDEQEKELLKLKVQELLIKNLHSILKPFLLRRMKKDVIKDLPPKKEYILYSHLTPMQSVFYAAAMDRMLPEFVLEAFLKEYLFLNHSDLFLSKADMKSINSILNKLSGEPFGGPKRDRRTRFDVADIQRIEEANDSDLMVSEYESADDGLGEQNNNAEPYNTEQEAQKSLAKLDEMVAMYEAETQGPTLTPASIPYEPDTSFLPKANGNFHDASSEQEVNHDISHGFNNGSIQNSKQNIAGTLSSLNTQHQSNDMSETTLKANNSSIGISDPPNAANIENTGRGTTPDVTDDATTPVRKKKERARKYPLFDEDAKTADVTPSRRTRNQGRPPKTTNRRGRSRGLFSDRERKPNLEQEVIEILSEEDVPQDERFELVKDLRNTFGTHVRRLGLQNVVMQLRKICYSHYAYYSPFPENEDHDEVFAKLMLQNSGKMQMLKQLLARLIPEGHKVLVFSQFTTALDLISIWLGQEGIACSQLDGRIGIDEREDEISDFTSTGDELSQVFLLSTRAGGLGLNLVSADTVVLFDNDWNPQMDLQAIGRVHRIGQTKPVKIFRFVVRNTVEELLIIKSFSKRLLEKMVIQLGDFQLGRVAKKLADEKIDLSTVTSMKVLFELGHKLNLHGSENVTLDQLDEILMQQNPVVEPLSGEEMAELMDRSNECYARQTLNFANVTSFETTNNFD